MAPRATFKGFLRLSLVSVPVKAFTATASDKEVRLNQLHRECNSRIKYKKTCPTHGEVKNDDIVSGYEYSKDQYVVIDPAEVSKLRKRSEKSVDIEGFVSSSQIEPRFYSGKMYYLLPDGPVGQKPYQLMRDTMSNNELFALATAVLAGREQVVVVRPVGKLLAMSVLQYAAKVKKPTEFEDEITDVKFSKDELELTKTLVEASRIEEFDLSSYKDDYVDQLTQLIQAKIDGEEVVTAPDVEEPKVINLMEALKASVENANVKTKLAPSKASSGRKAASKRTTKRKRSSS